MHPGLTIGEFAQLTQLSVRTLRRYHEAGLLEPASVDPASGYRYYAAEQIPTAQVIHRLRALDMPLAEVGRVLATSDPARRSELISGHLRRLEAELDRTRAAVTALRQLLSPDVEQLAVRLRSTPPCPSRNGRGDIGVIYGRLGVWVVEQALAVAGPIHERYLVGPRDDPAAGTWRTEIGWPVFRIAPA